MNKELTLFFPPGGFEILLVPAKGKDIMNYVDQQRGREIHEYIQRMNILSEGEFDDTL